MWKQVHQKTYANVKREDIWALLTHVNQWASWHADLDYCKLDGKFEVGNFFMLKPKGSSPVKIVLTEVIPGHKFTDCTTFWGAKMYDTHELKDTPQGLQLTNTISVVGPLRWLWVKIVAKDVANSAVSQMDELVHLARSKK